MVAGRPKRRAMIEELERLTKDYFDEDTGSTLDYAVAQIQSGKTIADMARSITTSLNVPISREMVTSYLHSLPEAHERIAGAKPTQALAMIEEAIAIVDEKPTDKLAVSWAMNKARVRESHARMINPEFQQQKQQGGLTLNIGALHLSALRMTNVELTRALEHDTSLTHARSIEPDQSSVVQIASHK